MRLRCSARVVAALASLALVACDAPTPSVVAPDPGVLPGTDAPLDALSRRHGRLRERLTTRGYEVTPQQARVFVLEGRGVALPVDLSTSQCHTFVAIGAAGLRDLQAALYDQEGVEVASDGIPGEGALVHTCPQPSHAEHPSAAHYLVLSAAEGLGAVAVTEARSAPGEGDGFEGLFEGLLAPSVPFRDVEDALARSRTALRARGLTPLDTPTIQTVAERGVERAEVQLEPGRCYVAVARGGEGVEDIDLYLFDRDGVEVARDIRRGAEAMIEHCAREGGHFVLEVRVYRGQGAVGIALFAGAERAPTAIDERSEPLDVGNALGGGPARGLVSSDPLLQLDVFLAGLDGLGFAPPVVVARSSVITPGEVSTHDVVVGPGCSLLVVAGSNDAMDLDLYLADENGREVDADTDIRSSAVVRACSDSARGFRAAVKGYGRDGTYALALVRAPSDARSVQALRLLEATAEPRARGFTLRSSQALELREGEQASADEPLDPGRCLRIAAAGDDRVRDLDLEILDLEGHVLSSDTGPSSFASLGRCAAADASEPLTVRWRARAYAGGGAVRVDVLEGPL